MEEIFQQSHILQIICKNLLFKEINTLLMVSHSTRIGLRGVKLFIDDPDKQINIIRNINNCHLKLAQEIEAKGSIPIFINSSSSGNVHKFKCLLNLGMDMNVKDEHGRESWFWATVNDHLDIMSLMIENGQDVNQKDESKTTALMYACEAEKCDEVKLLLSCKDIDLEITDCLGRSALIYACVQGNPIIVELLLKAGSTVQTGSFNAIEYARGFEEIVELLRKYVKSNK